MGKIMKNGFAATDPFLEKIFAGEKPEIKKEFSPEGQLDFSRTYTQSLFMMSHCQQVVYYITHKLPVIQYHLFDNM